MEEADLVPASISERYHLRIGEPLSPTSWYGEGDRPSPRSCPPPSSPESMEVESIGSDWEQLPSGGWRKPQAPPAPAVPPRQRPVKYVVGTLFEKHIIARIEDANNDRMAVLLERRRQREAAAMEREDCQAAPAGSAQRGNLPHPDQQRSGASQSAAGSGSNQPALPLREDNEFGQPQPGWSDDDYSSSEEWGPDVPANERIYIFMPQFNGIWQSIPCGPYGLDADGVIHRVHWMWVRTRPPPQMRLYWWAHGMPLGMNAPPLAGTDHVPAGSWVTFFLDAPAEHHRSSTWRAGRPGSSVAGTWCRVATTPCSGFWGGARHRGNSPQGRWHLGHSVQADGLLRPCRLACQLIYAAGLLIASSQQRAERSDLPVGILQQAAMVGMAISRIQRLKLASA